MKIGARDRGNVFSYVSVEFRALVVRFGRGKTVHSAKIFVVIAFESVLSFVVCVRVADDLSQTAVVRIIPRGIYGKVYSVKCHIAEFAAGRKVHVLFNRYFADRGF